MVPGLFRPGAPVKQVNGTAAEPLAGTVAGTVPSVTEPVAVQVSVLAEPDTSYERLVQVMDAVRGTHVTQGREIIRTELYPDIAIGDAPVVRKP